MSVFQVELVKVKIITTGVGVILGGFSLQRLVPGFPFLTRD